MTGTFRSETLNEWLQKHNPSQLEFKRAVSNFTRKDHFRYDGQDIIFNVFWGAGANMVTDEGEKGWGQNGEKEGNFTVLVENIILKKLEKSSLCSGSCAGYSVVTFVLGICDRDTDIF